MWVLGVAFERLAGGLAVELLGPVDAGVGGRAARAAVRALSPRLRDDRPLAGDIETVAASIRNGSLVAAVEVEAGDLG
jgi:histidine ammonia-lyase